MRTEALAPSVRAYLEAVARRLGAASPDRVLASVIDRTFVLPAGDGGYIANSLAPGALPIELSFVESEADCLRVDLEPCVLLNPVERRRDTHACASQIVASEWGGPRRAAFEAAASRVDFGSSDAPRFGAFLGATFDRAGLRAVKVYYEMTPDLVKHDIGGAGAIFSRVRRSVPCVTPVFVSVACERAGVAERVYLACRGELRLLDLLPLMRLLGLEHRLPELASLALSLDGATYALTTNGAILGIRGTAAGHELKLEIPVAADGGVQQAAWFAFESLLRERPESRRAYMTWLAALTSHGASARGTISVLSMRASAAKPCRIGLYVRPALESIEMTRIALLS
jgi:hypothetical protein